MDREGDIRSSVSTALYPFPLDRTPITPQPKKRGNPFFRKVHIAIFGDGAGREVTLEPTTRCQTRDFKTEITLAMERKREHLESELWSPGCTVRRSSLTE